MTLSNRTRRRYHYFKQRPMSSRMKIVHQSHRPPYAMIEKASELHADWKDSLEKQHLQRLEDLHGPDPLIWDLTNPVWVILFSNLPRFLGRSELPEQEVLLSYRKISDPSLFDEAPLFFNRAIGLFQTIAKSNKDRLPASLNFLPLGFEKNEVNDELTSHASPPNQFSTFYTVPQPLDDFNGLGIEKRTFCAIPTFSFSMRSFTFDDTQKRFDIRRLKRRARHTRPVPDAWLTRMPTDLAEALWQAGASVKATLMAYEGDEMAVSLECLTNAMREQGLWVTRYPHFFQQHPSMMTDAGLEHLQSVDAEISDALRARWHLNAHLNTLNHTGLTGASTLPPPLERTKSL